MYEDKEENTEKCENAKMFDSQQDFLPITSSSSFHLQGVISGGKNYKWAERLRTNSHICSLKNHGFKNPCLRFLLGPPPPVSTGNLSY